MTTIVLKYKGKCELGPWHGQQIDAEWSVIESDLLKGGAYRWRAGAWIWRPQAGSHGQSGPSRATEK